MLKRNRWFITLALVYALLAGLVGIARIEMPASLPGDILRIHGHLMLLGFVAFMIYGLGEHLLPRFVGNPIRFGAWTWIQQTLAHLGVAAFALGAVLDMRPLMSAGAGFAWLALLLFTLRILPVLWPRLPAGGAGDEKGG